jgi:phage tail sheath gpL-like
MSLDTAFNQVPLVVNTPGYYIEIDASHAVKGAAIQPHNVLIVGQMLTGSAAASTVYAVKLRR